MARVKDYIGFPNLIAMLNNLCSPACNRLAIDVSFKRVNRKAGILGDFGINASFFDEGARTLAAGKK
jgi:hypothetical protein